MKKYVCYEDTIAGKYTEAEFHSLYITLADKTEYENYSDWKWDMLRSGIFVSL